MKNTFKAFPYEESYNHGGMHLRDYFAAHCPESEIPRVFLEDVALYLNKPTHMVHGKEMTDGFKKLRALARYAYADAMMEARE